MVNAVRSAGFGIVVATALGAQPSTPEGVLDGRVLDRATGKSLPGARILLTGDGRSIVADSSGRYSFAGLPSGLSQLVISVPGFPDLTILIEMPPGERLNRAIIMDSTGRGQGPQTLSAVSVTAPAPVVDYRLTAFERRRKTGRGQYLTEEDIVMSGAYSVAEALRSMRGVTYECGGGRGCFVRMTRAPMRCFPEYVVDDQVVNDFGPLTPIRDIIALEVYTGPTDVPGEYAGRNSGCGVIVIWTRSGPTRRATRR